MTWTLNSVHPPPKKKYIYIYIFITKKFTQKVLVIYFHLEIYIHTKRKLYFHRPNILSLNILFPFRIIAISMLFYFKIKQKTLTPQFLNLQSTSESFLSVLRLLTSRPSPRPVDYLYLYLKFIHFFLFPLPPPCPAIAISYFVYSSSLPTHLVFTLICFIDFILLFTVYIKSCYYHLKNSPEVSRST